VSGTEAEHLRVIIANERRDRLAILAPFVRELGHEVVAHEIVEGDVAEVALRSEPDLAFVGVDSSSAHALDLIDRIAGQEICPVIAVLDEGHDGLAREAAEAGVFAYIVGNDPQTWQNTIEIALRRFADYHNLHAAFRRRVLIERAKGILMERHGVREAEAFELLRDEARRTNRRVVEVADAILEGHPLLPGHDS
jgi:response regulator NasT